MLLAVQHCGTRHTISNTVAVVAHYDSFGGVAGLVYSVLSGREGVWWTILFAFVALGAVLGCVYENIANCLGQRWTRPQSEIREFAFVRLILVILDVGLIGFCKTTADYMFQSDKKLDVKFCFRATANIPILNSLQAYISKLGLT